MPGDPCVASFESAGNHGAPQGGSFNDIENAQGLRQGEGKCKRYRHLFSDRLSQGREIGNQARRSPGSAKGCKKSGERVLEGPVDRAVSPEKALEDFADFQEGNTFIEKF